LALIIGAPWAVYQFWYKEIWLPSTKAAFATVNASVSCEDRGTLLLPVTGRIEVVNDGQRDANVFAAYYMIEGVRFAPGALRDPDYVASVRRSLADSLDITQRYAVMQHRQPVASGKILNAIGILVPGQHASANIVTFVPRDSFDVVRIYAFVITQPQYSQTAPAWEVYAGGYVRFHLAALTDWHGAGTGQYQIIDDKDPQIAKLHLNESIALSEAIVPRLSPTSSSR
jgi:hypothetical protein